MNDKPSCLGWCTVPRRFGRGASSAGGRRHQCLREKMAVVEDERYSRDYRDPEKRSIANAVQVHFKDGGSTDVAVEYPIGHRRHRGEGILLLKKKFANNLKEPLSSLRVHLMVPRAGESRSSWLWWWVRRQT
jgi:2-methylcitrate dehydratase PrpD